ncbi:MAG: polysaccharide biosynthesis protein, partial [Clostridia bacterium]|nr:polysaccharide biosynthesis protein [Clostridia bacterium]
MTKKSFVKGAAILAAAGLLVKVLGAVFRIPLTNLITPDGMANYSVAYPIYATLVVISTAGLPSAISRMVSARVIVGDYRGAHKVFTTALKLLFVVGLISTIALFFLADTIATMNKIPTAALGIKLISPSLFFVAVLSAYRGYFQGLQQMVPTASTQIVEQVVKLGAGLLLASLWISRGVEYGAAGALLGVSLSEVGALALIIIMYNRRKKDIKLHRRQTHVPPLQTKYKSLRRELVTIAIPITLGASIMPIIMAIDTFIINNILPLVDYSAFNPLPAKTNFGILTGSVNPLVNMPAVLSVALAMSLVPAISEARAKNDLLAVSSRSGMGFKLAILIGLPSALG